MFGFKVSKHTKYDLLFRMFCFEKMTRSRRQHDSVNAIASLFVLHTWVGETVAAAAKSNAAAAAAAVAAHRLGLRDLLGGMR